MNIISDSVTDGKEAAHPINVLTNSITNDRTASDVQKADVKGLSHS